jgi:hypothetical protein
MSTATTERSPDHLDVPSLAVLRRGDDATDRQAVQARRLAEARQDAEDRLAALLAQAGRTELDDVPAWAHLRATAHATVAVLIARGLVPEALRVRHHDAPVVIARTLAAAWQRVALG